MTPEQSHTILKALRFVDLAADDLDAALVLFAGFATDMDWSELENLVTDLRWMAQRGRVAVSAKVSASG